MADAAPSWRRSLRAASIAFLLSRLLVFGIWSAVACLAPQYPTEDAPFRQYTIVLDRGAVARSLRELAMYNDAGWYFGIARDGYERRPFDTSRQANWAFFPLHPMVWRAFLAIDIDPAWTGLLLANLEFLGALILLHRLALAFGFTAAVADRSLLFLCLWPASYFFSLPWSESLFLFGSTATFLAVLKQRWPMACMLGTGVCACRPTGIFLVIALGLHLWLRRKEVPAIAWWSVALMPAGLIAFMAVLWLACGDPLAFADIQGAWGRYFIVPYRAFGVVLAKPWFLASDWNLRPLNFLAFALGMAACIGFWRRREHRPLAVFLGLSLASAAFTGELFSLARYAAGLFPFALAGGCALQRRGPELGYAIVSAALLVLLALAYQARLAFAGA